ncbi:hypothetical protein HBN50_16555 [Halobacteriovorax sp. GB3]|uniref:hypothetical protein n=1 Tax=Halobacteriovorax sp. GB3 TaxID=2719615 RepID=UPI00235F5DCD|nr:hypothetical protein [Halobacteriovorax sp. GB3]MDD0854722.1 hypothetical protein [Halobacteriovorax sp. GB3]
MLVQKKWAKVLGLAISFPSSIFGVALIVETLIENDVVSKKIGWLLFIVFIVNTISLMVWYALKVKTKD